LTFIAAFFRPLLMHTLARFLVERCAPFLAHTLRRALIKRHKFLTLQ